MSAYSVLMSLYAKTSIEELKLSIDSMLRQTLLPDQLVLIFDGAVSEELRDTVREYDEENPGAFTIVELHENQGLAKALNEGIKACRNELVARMDTDDYSLPTRCEEQVLAFEKNKELAILGTAIAFFEVNPHVLTGKESHFPTDLEAIKETIRRNSAFSHPTVMFRKSVIEQVGGYDPDLRRSQDHDLFSRVVSEGYMCSNIDKVLFRYKADGANIARNKNPESCRARILIQKRLLARKQCTLWDYWVIWSRVTIARILPDWVFSLVYKLLKKR